VVLLLLLVSAEVRVVVDHYVGRPSTAATGPGYHVHRAAQAGRPAVLLLLLQLRLRPTATAHAAAVSAADATTAADHATAAAGHTTTRQAVTAHYRTVQAPFAVAMHWTVFAHHARRRGGQQCRLKWFAAYVLHTKTNNCRY